MNNLQDEVIAFLSRPSSYGTSNQPVERYEKKQKAVQLMHQALSYLHGENPILNHLTMTEATFYT